MLITSRGYMQTRSLEAGLGLVMLVSGVMFYLPGFIDLSQPAYAELRKLAPGWLNQTNGGLILVLIALVRWAALVVNSHHHSTPLFRLLGCAIGCGFWCTVSIAFYRSLDIVPWIAGITACFAFKEAYSGFRTGLDVDALDSLGLRTRAYKKKQQRREVEGA